MRGKRAKKRKAIKDPRYKSEVIARLINKVMQGGKKTLAQEIVYGALEDGAKKKDVEVLEFVNTALDNLRPALEVRSRRVGGSTYQVPVPVTPKRQETLAIRWLVDACRSKSGKSFQDILRDAFLEAYNGEGEVFKKKLDVERMAEANKAFAHFRW